MIPLQELVDRLTDLIDQLNNEGAVIAKAQTLSDLSEALIQPQEAVNRVVEFAAEAIESGVLVDRLSVPRADALAMESTEMARRLSESGGQALTPAEAAELRANITGFASEARALASIGWREYCMNNRPPEISVGFLSVFEKVNPTGVATLREHLSTAEMHSRVEVPGMRTMRAFVDAVNQIPQLLGDMVGQDPEVNAFVQALAGEGATLEMLTPVVTSWMKERKLPDGRPVSELFRVVLGREDS